MAINVAQLLSIQTGKVQTIEQKHSCVTPKWTTAFFKESVDGMLNVGFDGLEGDEVADTAHHGGVDKAIFVNSVLHYESWCRFLQRSHLPFGALGENFTVSTLSEEQVCIGDIYRIGTALFEVTQPRKPCWKISKRWEESGFTRYIYDSGKTGWYMRVLQEGVVCRADGLYLVQRPPIAVTVMEATRAFQNPSDNEKTVKNLLFSNAAAPSFKESLRKRIQKRTPLSFMDPPEG